MLSFERLIKYRKYINCEISEIEFSLKFIYKLFKFFNFERYLKFEITFIEFLLKLMLNFIRFFILDKNFHLNIF